MPTRTVLRTLQPTLKTSYKGLEPSHTYYCYQNFTSKKIQLSLTFIASIYRCIFEVELSIAIYLSHFL